MKPLLEAERSKLLLLVAILLGGLVRFLPALTAGFPVNDGGMFMLMSEELKANHYALPAFTAYNQAHIPFAYPPLGFYVTALISDLFSLPVMAVERWSPALVSTLALLAFFLMAREALNSDHQAGLATIFYGLAPASFGWAVMGGGITRAYGLAFLYLTVAWTMRLYARPRATTALLTAVFGALAALSHPETGLQAAAACLLLWFFRGRSRMSMGWSIVVAVCVLVFTAPWWGTVLAVHGAAPFLSATQTSNDRVTAIVQLVTLQIDGNNVFFPVTVALGLIGLVAGLARRRYLLPLWFLLPFLVDPRSAGGIAMIPLAMMAAVGFDQVLAPGLLALRSRTGDWFRDRFALATLSGVLLYLFFSAGVFGIKLANASLSEPDRRTIAWVRENVDPGSVFLLLTGEPYSMKDPLQEWFPALTPSISMTTIQGLEWTLGPHFFPRYGDLVALQHCAEVACVEAWSERTGLRYRYLLVRNPPQDGPGGLDASLRLLVGSLDRGDGYQLVYETPDFVIYRVTE